MIDGMTRLIRIVLVALGLVVLGAAPAAADSAGPSDFRSEVTGIVPAVDGVDAEIRGGDAFLEVTVDPDHTVIVEGYQGEPYLRFQPDGVVERNRLSTATYLNDDRQGGGTIPPEVQQADPDTPPVWERIADGGSYAWHDHRVHWMQDSSPSVSRGEQVPGAYDPWRVPIVVDGAPTEIQGILVYEESVSPLPYIGIGLLAAIINAVLLRGQPRVAAGSMAVVAAACVVVGWGDYSSTPDGGGNPLLWALPAVALVAAVGGAALAKRTSGAILTLVSVASLFGWGIFRFQALLKPVLPTDLPFAFDRAMVALSLGVSAAVAIVTITTGALALPELEDD